jgi:hypothetical protein
MTNLTQQVLSSKQQVMLTSEHSQTPFGSMAC